MKESDIAVSESERQAAAAQLTQTEATNAVNTGLVASADKSTRSLGFSGTSRTSIDSVSRTADGGFEVTATKRGVLGMRSRTASFDVSGEGAEALTQKQVRRILSREIRRGVGEGSFSPARQQVKAIGKGAVVHKVLEDSELEGADKAYYKAKGAVRLTKKAARHITGKAGAANKRTLGELAEKKYLRKEKDPREILRKMQSKRNQAAAMGKAAGAKTAAGAGAAHAAAAGSAAASSGGGGLLAAGAGGCLLPLLGAVLVFILFVALLSSILGGSGSNSSSNGFGPLFYWVEYETGKTDDTAFDCVTLDDGAGGQAYGVQFDYRYDLQPFLKWLYSKDPTTWVMFAPYVNCPISSLWASSDSDGVAGAWHRAYADNKNGFINAQKEFITNNTLNPKIKQLEADGYDFSERSEVCKGAVLSWIHQHGPGNLTASTLRQAGITNSTSDDAFLDKLYALRISKYGHWGGLDLESRYTRELQTAKMYLYMGTSDYVSAAIAIANDDSHGYSQTTGDGGAGRTLNPDVDCSSLVYYALLNSGYSKDQIGNYPFSTYSMPDILPKAGFTKHAFTSIDDLQPGDILLRDGHTEIYIGNGKNVGAHRNYDKKPGDSSGQEVDVGNCGTNWSSYYRSEGKE